MFARKIAHFVDFEWAYLRSAAGRAQAQSAIAQRDDGAEVMGGAGDIASCLAWRCAKRGIRIIPHRRFLWRLKAAWSQ